MPGLRHLPRDHAADVVLECQVVDRADAAAEPAQLDRAPVPVRGDADRAAAADAQDGAAGRLLAAGASRRTRPPASCCAVRGPTTAIAAPPSARTRAPAPVRIVTARASRSSTRILSATARVECRVRVEWLRIWRLVAPFCAMPSAPSWAMPMPCPQPRPRQGDQRGGGRSRRGAEHHGQGGQRLAHAAESSELPAIDAFEPTERCRRPRAASYPVPGSAAHRTLRAGSAGVRANGQIRGGRCCSGDVVGATLRRV